MVLTPRDICSFGSGEDGKLRHGTVKQWSMPQFIEKLKGHRVVSIASYNEHTAALVEPGHDSRAVRRAFGTHTAPVTTSFVKHMGYMVDNDEFSYIVFKVDDECVHAHRSILANRCKHFFTVMIRSGMR